MPKTRSKEKKKEYKEKAVSKIHELLQEKDFYLRRSIQLLLEEHDIYHTITVHAINELQEKDELRTAKYPKRGNHPQWIYREDLRLKDIKDQIENDYIPIHDKFSEASSKVGEYAQNIIEESLTKAGFTIVSKEGSTQYFNGKEFPKNNDIDFIALKDDVFYGIEVRNKLPHANFKKIMDKKELADFHDIQFVLISRNPGRTGYKLFQEGGLHLDYGYYIWDPEFSRIAEKVKEKLHYPLKCLSSPPEDLIEDLKEIPRWHEKHFPEKGVK